MSPSSSAIQSQEKTNQRSKWRKSLLAWALRIPSQGQSGVARPMDEWDLFMPMTHLPFLYAQLAKPFDEIDLPPPNIQEYLNTHRSDLDELYNLVLQNEAPQWEIDIQKGFRAPVPTFFSSPTSGDHCPRHP